MYRLCLCSPLFSVTFLVPSTCYILSHHLLSTQTGEWLRERAITIVYFSVIELIDRFRHLELKTLGSPCFLPMPAAFPKLPLAPKSLTEFANIFSHTTKLGGMKHSSESSYENTNMCMNASVYILAYKQAREKPRAAATPHHLLLLC